MNDRSISTTSFLAGLSWTVAVLLVFVDLVSTAELGEAGILFGGAAVVMNVRSMLNELGDRERNAYLIGRNSRTVDRQ